MGVSVDMLELCAVVFVMTYVHIFRCFAQSSYFM